MSIEGKSLKDTKGEVEAIKPDNIDKPIGFGQSLARLFGVGQNEPMHLSKAISKNKTTDKVITKNIIAGNEGYNPMDYLEDSFPAKAKITEGTYQGDWRDEVREAVSSDWSYSQHVDEMRDRVVYFASKASINVVFFESPYDTKEGSNLSIEIRQASDRASAVALKITEGQIVSNRDYKYVLDVRFDDGDIESYEWSELRCDSDTAIIYKNADRFIEKLKASQHVMIEMSFYARRDYSNLAFKFDVSNLVWEHKPTIVNESSITIEADEVADDGNDDVSDDESRAVSEPIYFDITGLLEPELIAQKTQGQDLLTKK